MRTKGAHNTVADAISHIDYAPFIEQNHHWMMFTQRWKATPGAAIFGWDICSTSLSLLTGPIRDYRQPQTDCNTAGENIKHVEWEYTIGDKVLVWKDGILCKGESKYLKDPWTITQVHMNDTIRI